ncbi:MAG: family 16 glycosylhydrolase [Cytophagaceae bacterium]|nr:family 16 glycosylhydrolase [Cytophagaceae bacterium]
MNKQNLICPPKVIKLFPTPQFLLCTLLYIVSILPAYSQCQQLVWSDEFNGTSLDLTKWSYQTGNGTNDGLPVGWGNNERQYYTSRAQNIRVQNGNLEITALAENYLGAQYTSARIRTKNTVTGNPNNEWKYGSFEARIKVPEPFADSRAWPAFWMLPNAGPWPNTGEIDIMETGLNGQPWTFNGTIFYYNGGTQNTGTGPVTVSTAGCPGNPGDMSTCFHVFRVDWSPNLIQWYVDGVLIGQRTPANTIGGTWPYDAVGRNYHLILNMAVGGWFPGTPVPNNARFPLTMQVDYVRVYSNPSATQITGKTKVMQGDNGWTYSVTVDPTSTVNWSVPAGATIVSGQGTSQITVNYGAGAVSGNVSATITPVGAGCVASTVNLPVSVLANTCTLILENFEASAPPTRNLGFNFSTGWMNRPNAAVQSNPYGTFANPGAAGINTSANVGKYERNAGVAYDVLAYNDIAVGNAAQFRNGVTTFNMHVRTDAPAGTQVMVQLENRNGAQTGWPNGIYARFTAVTGAPNTWTNLVFTLLDTPDAMMPANQVDQLVLFFNPNSNTNNTYYFDNFIRAGITPNTSAITGVNSVCQNNAGVVYSVTGLPGSTYNWTVPAGATIASGQGTNSIVVNFGTTSGNVTVTETSAVNCVGPTRTLAVTVAGACVLTANFSATPLTTCAGATVVFTDLTTGKTGGEIYSWDFGPGASLPAGTTGAGPHNVTYSTGGAKTATLTVTKGAANDVEVKTNYITVTPPPASCLFQDDFSNATVNWITPIPGAFSHAEAGTVWTVSNAGYAEWDNFIYTLNNGTIAQSLNFACPMNKPILKIRAKASANALLRIQMLDATGKSTDNVPGFNMELTTTYQTFTIDYAGDLRNFYGATPGFLDSANINRLQFFINPGYVSFPYAGVNGTYNTAFGGTVDIEWIGIGDNCNNTLPVELIYFSVKESGDNAALISWTTASEKNNSHFEILRSSDGKDFEKVGRIEGSGTSNVENNYSFIDHSLNGSIYYYMLKQVDYDGASSYSEIKSIHYNQEAYVNVFPTLVSAGDPIHVESVGINEVKIEISDVNGKIFFNNNVNSVHEIQTKDLLPGIYIVKIASGDQVTTKKIMVY